MLLDLFIPPPGQETNYCGDLLRLTNLLLSQESCQFLKCFCVRVRACLRVCGAGNFNLYAPRVARPLVPAQGKVYFLGGEIRGGGADRYNVRTREVITNSQTLADWSVEEQEL